MSQASVLDGLRSDVVCLFVIAGRVQPTLDPSVETYVQCTSPGVKGNWLVCASVCVTCRWRRVK